MKKKIVIDMAVNLIATAIPIFVLQLIILPRIALYMPDDSYGFLVTVLAFLNVVPATAGNVLNNIRLLLNNEYESEGLAGDFNLLVAILSTVSAVSTLLFLLFYDKNPSTKGALLTVLVCVLWLMKEYYIVAFRIIISYRSILICNLCCVLGYGIGFLLFRMDGTWQYIYIFGLALSLCYCFKNSPIWKEPFARTKLFQNTNRQTIMLLTAKLLNRVITYADKIIIFPFLGGAVVSIYYAATVFGKVVSLMITPINSVALTYLSKLKNRKDSMFSSALLLGTGVCTLGYVFCILVSKPILSILYPQYVGEALKYIKITTATTVIYALASIVDPFIMKFYDMKWQIIINSSTVAVYLILCLGTMMLYGLAGFCAGALITNVLKLGLMILIYYKGRGIQDSDRTH